MAKNKYVTSGSNIQELISAVQQSNKILEETQQDNLVESFAMKNINNVIVDIGESISAIEKIIVGKHMKDLESVREQSKYNDDLLKAIKDLKSNKPPTDKKEEGEFSWLGLAGSLIAGLVMGGIAFVTNYVKGFIKFWTATAKALKVDGLIMKVFTLIQDGFIFIKNLVSGGFSKAWGFIKGFFGESKLLGSIGEFFTKVWQGIKNLFKYEGLLDDFAALWTNIKGIFKMIFDPIGKLFGGGGGGFIDDIVKYITKAATFFKPITGFFKVLGSILGKLAYPLQIIMSIWDTVSGALDGWNNTEGGFMDKLFGAIKGGLTGLLNGLIGGLLDLLKDGLVWILDALGFDKAVKFLESFSFSDLIGKLVGGYVDMIKGMVDWVMELFTNPKAAMAKLADGIGKLGDMAKNFLKGLLKSVLPNPQGGVMEKLAAKAIPDSVYEFAGLDPKTGSALKEATSENTAATGEKMVNEAVAAGKSAVQGVVNAGQTIINNGNTAIVSAKSKVHDMEDMWARGGMSMMGA
jgi:hypothetical protein